MAFLQFTGLADASLIEVPHATNQQVEESKLKCDYGAKEECETIKMKKAAFIVALAVSFLALIPISVRLANPLFTRPFDDKLQQQPVLLVWPDRVEIRQFQTLSEELPLARGAGYTFNISPERQAWVEKAVQAIPSSSPGKSSWVIKVKQVNPLEQRVTLELLGDGIYGIVYEAYPGRVVPLQSLLTGPGGALVFLVVNIVLWVVGWTLVWLIRKFLSTRSPNRMIQ